MKKLLQNSTIICLIVMMIFLPLSLAAQTFVGTIGNGSGQHSVAVDSNGLVYAWGKNNNGQLGDDDQGVDKLVPVIVSGGAYGAGNLGDNPANKIIKVAQGAYHTLALAQDGSVYSWGNYGQGQLGYNTTANSSVVPGRVLKGAYDGTTNLGDDPTNKIISVTAGSYVSIALAEDGTVYSWGGYYYGQLGNNTTENTSIPVRVLAGDDYTGTYLGDDPNNKIIAVSAYYQACLALAEDGSVYGWGWNENGQTGDGTFGLSGTPDYIKEVPVRSLMGDYNGTTYLGDDPNNKIISVCSNNRNSYAVAEDGTVYSWGRGSDGQLGDGTSVQKVTPVRVLMGAYGGTTYLGDDPNNKIISVEPGHWHTIALAEDGSVYSWGNNSQGQLGINSVAMSLIPVQVLMGAYNGTTYLGDDPNNKITDIASGMYFSFGVTANGFIYGWGENDYGNLGDNTSGTDRLIPVQVLGVGGVGYLNLPVELSSFAALPTDGRVTLNWVTQSEMENLGFIVERSSEEDGIYLEISSFKTNSELQGQGNSATETKYSYTDNDVENGRTYYYKLADVDINGIKTYTKPISVKLSALPKVFQLHQNYPNPFNPETTIKYDVPSLKGKTVQVNITIYNTLGQAVRKLYVGKKTAGVHTITWDGSNEYGSRMSSGVYFMVFNAGEFRQMRKMMLMQ